MVGHIVVQGRPQLEDRKVVIKGGPIKSAGCR